MDTKRKQKLRDRAFTDQNERCYYCKQPMWQDNKTSFAFYFGISKKQAMAFKCTAEHLISIKDGGTLGYGNIVAACHYCNEKRNTEYRQLDSVLFAKIVDNLMRHSAWRKVKLCQE